MDFVRGVCAIRLCRMAVFISLSEMNTSQEWYGSTVAILAERQNSNVGGSGRGVHVLHQQNMNDREAWGEAFPLFKNSEIRN